MRRLYGYGRASPARGGSAVVLTFSRPGRVPVYGCGGPIKMNSRPWRIGSNRRSGGVGAGRSTLTLAARSARASRRRRPSRHPRARRPPGPGGRSRGPAHRPVTHTQERVPRPTPCRNPRTPRCTTERPTFTECTISAQTPHDSDREDTAAELHSADNSFVRASVRGSRESGSAFQSSGAGRATGQVAARRGAGENFLAECVCISQGYLSTRPQNRAARNRNCGRGTVSR